MTSLQSLCAAPNRPRGPKSPSASEQASRPVGVLARSPRIPAREVSCRVDSSPPTPYSAVESFEIAKAPLSADAGVIRGRRLVIIRVPDFEKFPDGDAMNGFTKTTEPPGLVARLTHHVTKAQAGYACEPRAASGPFKRRGDKIKIVFSDSSQLTSLLRIRRRGVSVARDVPSKAAALSDRNLFRDYPLMVPVLLPDTPKVLNAVADGVGAANEEKDGEKMTPYLSETLARASAAVSMQSAFRSYLCRKRLAPGIAEMVLTRRAAVCVQRAYVNHTRKLRVVMYKQLREMLTAIGTKTCELEVTGEAMGQLIGFLQEGPRQIFTEQKYMYAFDPYDNVFTCRLPAGFPSSAARVDPALDRGLSKWIGVSVPHAPVEAMADADPEETETHECTDIIPMLTENVETVDAPPKNDQEGLGGGGGGPPTRLMRFDTNEEARRRAALIFVYTWDPHTRDGVRLLPAPKGSFQAVVAEEKKAALMETETDEAEERRKEKLKRFPPGSPMIPFVDMLQNPDASLFPNRPSTKGSLTMVTEADFRDLHGSSRQGRRQPRRRRRQKSSNFAGSQVGTDDEGGYSTGDGGYSSYDDRATTAGTMTMHPEPFFIPRGSRRPDPRYSLGYASDGDGWDSEAEPYYAGGVGALVNEKGMASDQWGSLGMGLDFAPQARSRAETWLNNEVKATLADIRREEKRATQAIVADRALADEVAKRAAIAAAAFQPSVRRSANTSNMTMMHKDDGPTLTHAQRREQLEELRAARRAEKEAEVARVKEEHRKSLEKFKSQEMESKRKLRKAGAVAKREMLQEVEAARGEATRGNRWSVVVERHRNLRKVGRRDERVFAASFGRQQAALGKQIAAAELRHRGSMKLGQATSSVAASRVEEAERRVSVANQKLLQVERARELSIVMTNDLDIAKETMRERREAEVSEKRERLLESRERKTTLKNTGKRAPDREVLKMTRVSSAT